MKDIKSLDPVLLEEYNIHVNRYLTYAQIQYIVNSVRELDSWSERQQNIDMLVLYYATDIGAEKLEEIGHDVLLTSGLLHDVKQEIENFYAIDIALDYTESIQRSLTQISRELPKYMDEAEDVIKNGGKK